MTSLHVYLSRTHTGLPLILLISSFQVPILIINHPQWIDVNAIYPKSLPPSAPFAGHHLLSAAVCCGNIERIKILTQHPYIKLDINQVNHWKFTALTHTIMSWGPMTSDIPKLSQEKGADPCDHHPTCV